MPEQASEHVVHDLIGIGVGPFNLSLAALAEPITDLDALFLDENPDFDWHPGLLLEGATLQTPFLADLVTLADPTSPYSFLNYLKATGRIYAFYIREQFFMLRAEYNRYCRWVAARLDSVVFQRRVTAVVYDPARACYEVTSHSPADGRRHVYRAQRVVLGTGPQRFVPECCRGLSDQVLHASDYLDHRETIRTARSITIVGSGQSAAEIFMDRLATAGPDQRLDWFTRSPRFFAMAYDKLTLELTSPEYIDYFHGLPEHTRQRLSVSQKPLYKGIDRDLSAAIYDRLYEKSLHGTANVGLQANAALTGAAHDGHDGLQLAFRQIEQGMDFVHDSQVLILATGFSYRVPEFIEPLRERLCWDEAGRFAVSRGYAVDRLGREVFVQNAELHTHGFTASDLGMACYRNAVILAEILGRAVYPIEQEIAFQTFDARSAYNTPNASSREQAHEY